jgi:hypothetical protein
VWPLLAAFRAAWRSAIPREDADLIAPYVILGEVFGLFLLHKKVYIFRAVFWSP